MSKGQRVGLIVIALAIAVAAFFVLRSGEDEPERAAPPAAAPPDEAAKPGAEKPDKPAKPAEPAATKIEVEGGSPVGGVEKIEVDKGDEVLLEVETDASAEVHVHGYDVFEEVEPGKPAKFGFPAELEGIFEVELETTHTPIAELRVSP